MSIDYGYCHCGCGKQTPISLRKYTKRNWTKGEPIPYLKGHTIKRPFTIHPILPKNKRVQKGKWKKESNHWRTCRYRSRTTTDHSSCAWNHIGGCKGLIEVVHVDGDFTNNSDSNKLPLCRSHHRLLDHGKINPCNPIMPYFKVGTDGRRRYRGASSQKG